MHPIIDFCRDMLGVKLYPGQMEALNNYYESGKKNWLLLAGRRGGKSLLSDCIAAYEATVSDFSADLRAGEERYILIISIRLDNAALHIKSIGKLLRHNRQLGRMIVRETIDRIELSNGTVVLSLPASARAGRGFTCSTLLLDELSFFVDSAGNQSADAVYTALEPTTATFADRSRIIVTTSVNTRVGVVYELYEASLSGENDFYLTKATSRDLNPKVSQKSIDAAARRDLESANAEYYSIFRDPIECYLNSESIDACIDQGGSEALKAKPGCTYILAFDPATQRDRFAYTVFHKEDNLYVLDYANAIRPPVDVAKAEELVFDLARRFDVAAIFCDTASTVSRLQGKLPKLEYKPFTRSFKLEIYGSLKEHISMREVVLYPHADLLDELRSLQIRNGNDISAPRAGKITHDDLSDCAALCIWGLSSGKYDRGGVTWIPDPTLFWDDQYFNVEPEVEEAHKRIWEDQVKKWEIQFLRPHGGKWHIWTQPHPAGVNWQTCKHHNDGCLSCIKEMQEGGIFEMDENDIRLQPGYTSRWYEEQQMRELRAQQIDDRRAEEAQIVRNFWKYVRSKKDVTN